MINQIKQAGHDGGWRRRICLTLVSTVNLFLFSSLFVSFLDTPYVGGRGTPSYKNNTPTLTILFRKSTSVTKPFKEDRQSSYTVRKMTTQNLPKVI